MARLIYRKVRCVSSQNQSRAGVSPAVSIYPPSSGAIAARHSCQADTMVTSAARTNVRINKGATGSPSLSKTKRTRRSAGLVLEACQCAGGPTPQGVLQAQEGAIRASLSRAWRWQVILQFPEAILCQGK